MAKLNFNGTTNPETFALYEALNPKNLGDLDIGVPKINSEDQNPQPEIIGAKDGKIDVGEVWRVGLNRFIQNPEDKKIESSFLNFTDGINPWKLDETSVREAKAVITLIDKNLTQRGLRKEEKKYRELMATGLFWFAQAPRIDYRDRSLVYSIGQKLLSLGLQDLQKYILINGGLGLATFGGDPTLELSASETLQQRKGQCTERSKVMFALYSLAKLDPFFAQTSTFKAVESLKKKGLVPNDAEADFNFATHTFIGIPLVTSFRYVDPLFSADDVSYEDTENLDLLNYLAVDFTNRANAYTRIREYDKADSLLRRAKLLDPNLLEAYTSTSYLKELAGDSKTLFDSAQETVNRFPNSGHAHHSLAIAFFKLKKDLQALRHARKAVQLNPNQPLFIKFLAELEEKLGNIKESQQAWDQLIQLRPATALVFIGVNPELTQFPQRLIQVLEQLYAKKPRLLIERVLHYYQSTPH